MRALIVDQGIDRSGLVAARALHADGWEVGTGAPMASLTGMSRAVSRRHFVPAAQDGVERYVNAVASAVRTGPYDVVIVCDDSGVLTLSRHRDRLGALVPYGPHEVVQDALDKLTLTRQAEAAGIAVPRTVEADAAAVASWQGPAVVKPRSHFSFRENVPGRLETDLLEGPEAIGRRCDELRELGGAPLLQEPVSGPLMACALVADGDHELVARVQQVSDLTWPPDVGVTARGRTIPLDRDLWERIADLVHRLRWFGLAQLQFLVPEDGEPRLLDLNGRPYGSLSLAIAAGVNLPAIWLRLATGQPLAAVPVARVGARSQWLSRDLRASVARQGMLRGVVDSLRHAPGSAHSIWSARDPAPALRFYGPKLTSLARGLLRRD